VPGWGAAVADVAPAREGGAVVCRGLIAARPCKGVRAGETVGRWIAGHGPFPFEAERVSALPDSGTARIVVTAAIRSGTAGVAVNGWRCGTGRRRERAVAALYWKERRRGRIWLRVSDIGGAATHVPIDAGTNAVGRAVETDLGLTPVRWCAVGARTKATPVVDSGDLLTRRGVRARGRAVRRSACRAARADGRRVRARGRPAPRVGAPWLPKLEPHPIARATSDTAAPMDNRSETTSLHLLMFGDPVA